MRFSSNSSLIAFAHGRASSYVASDIAIPPGRWQPRQLRCRTLMTSLLNLTLVVMGSCALEDNEEARTKRHTKRRVRNTRRRGDAASELALAASPYGSAISLIRLVIREAHPADHHLFKGLIAPSHFLLRIGVVLVLVRVVEVSEAIDPRALRRGKRFL